MLAVRKHPLAVGAASYHAKFLRRVLEQNQEWMTVFPLSH